MDNLKKTSYTLLKNPQIGLALVVFLFISASLTKTIFHHINEPVFYIMTFLLFLLTCAFLSGWFGMIKCALSHNKAADYTEEIKNWNETIQSFLSSIPVYILSIAFYFIVFTGFIFLILYLADKLIGHPGDILAQIANMTNDKNALINLYTTIPYETKILILKRSIFIYCSLLLYLFLTLYSIPALFFNKNANPLIGYKNSVLAIFKKPFFSLFLFLSILLTHIFISFLEAVSTINMLLMFFAFVLRISFIVYVVVLIFSVYGTKFKNNCDNGSDCLGQDISRG